jgi:transcriptional/translational regulatory protein YebC/TACO1
VGRAFEKRKATIFKRMDRVGKLFTKVGKEIAIAVKAGGPSPDGNPALRRARG